MVKKDSKDYASLAELQKELEYRPSLSHSLMAKPNEQKYTALATKKTHQLYVHYFGSQTLSEEIKAEAKKVFSEVLTNFETAKLSNINSIKLKQTYKTKKDVKDLVYKLRLPELISKNQLLLQKELKEKVIKLEMMEKSYAVKRANATKPNRFKNKLKQHHEVRIAKLKIRIGDIKSFIASKSAFSKVYLSDEPTLTKLGWIKLLMSYALILFWALVILWPIFELVKATLNDDAVKFMNVSTYSFGFDSFNRLFSNTRYSSWLTNTVVIAVVTSALTVVTTLLMGFAFSRYRFKGKKTSLLSVLILQMVPFLSALTVFYVIYTLLNQTFKISGQFVLVLIYVGGGIAGNTFIMKGYMDSISMEIDEAAKIDGLSQWRIFTRIITPLVRPMIALVALWSFIGPFGDFILPSLFISEPDKLTLAQGLRVLITDSYQLDQAAFAAGSLIVAVPASVLFIGLRKFLVGGITAGGVKG